MDSGLGGLRLRLTSPSKSSARPRQNSQESHFADSKLRVMRAALKEIESRHPARDVLEELRLPGADIPDFGDNPERIHAWCRTAHNCIVRNWPQYDLDEPHCLLKAGVLWRFLTNSTTATTSPDPTPGSAAQDPVHVQVLIAQPKVHCDEDGVNIEDIVLDRHETIAAVYDTLLTARPNRARYRVYQLNESFTSATRNTSPKSQWNVVQRNAPVSQLSFGSNAGAQSSIRNPGQRPPVAKIWLVEGDEQHHILAVLIPRRTLLNRLFLGWRIGFQLGFRPPLRKEAGGVVLRIGACLDYGLGHKYPLPVYCFKESHTHPDHEIPEALRGFKQRYKVNHYIIQGDKYDSDNALTWEVLRNHQYSFYIVVC